MIIKARAGDYRDTFDLMRKVELEDPLGGKSLSLEIVQANVRGKITPLSSREGLFAQQRMANTSHIVKMRWRPAGIEDSWIIRWGSRYLAILGHKNLEELGRVAELDCEERPPEGVTL